MKIRFLISASLITLLFGGGYRASAQETPIFMYGNVRQYAELQYLNSGSGFTRNGAGGGDTTSYNRNAVTPAYVVTTEYAVYDPRLLHGSMLLNLKYDMNMVSQGSGSAGNYNNLDLNYNISGKLLEKKPVPFTFFAQREQQWIQHDFGAGYDQLVESYGGGFSVRNPYLPTQVNYSWTRSNSSSGIDSWSQDYKLLTLQSANKLGKISYSTLNLNYSQSDNSSDSVGKFAEYSSDNLSLTFNNTLNWDYRSYHNKRVQSVITFEETMGTFSNRSCNWSESVFLDFGKALQTAVIYAYNNSDFSGSNNFDQTNSTHTGSAWVNHKLFDSITTHLDLTGTNSAINDGSTNNVAGGGSLGYVKSLPNASTLQLQFSGLYGVTERNLTSSNQQVNGEDMTVTLTKGYTANNIKNSNVVAATIEVWNNNFSRKYLAGTDYLVYTQGTLTYLDFAVPGSQLVESAPVKLRYQYIVDPNTSFSTTTFSSSANLSLLDNRYRFFAYYTDTTQNRISGRSDLLYLTSQSSVRTGGEFRLPAHFLAMEYTRLESNTDRREGVQGRWAFTPSPIGVNVVTFSAVDTYSWYRFGAYQASTITGGNPTLNNGSDNVLTVQGTYSRPVLRAGMFRLSLNYMMTRGNMLTRDSINGTLNYELSLGKFLLILDGSMNLIWLPTSSQNDYTVRLLVRRYF
jgi:hypothetical protein